MCVPKLLNIVWFDKIIAKQNGAVF